MTPPRPIRFRWLLLISFLIYSVGIFIWEALQWTDQAGGMISGAIMAMACGPAWLLFSLPWALLFRWLFKRGILQRWRAAWMLVPSAIVAGMTIWGGISIARAPERHFETLVHARLPGDATEFRYDFFGGGLANHYDMFYFRSSPKEIEGLIAAMKLSPERGSKPDELLRKHPEWPDYSRWPRVCYRRDDKIGNRFYYLITNDSKTEAYVLVFSI